MTVSSWNPRTGHVVTEAEETTGPELDVVVRQAGRAAPVLARTSPAERRRWLFGIAAALEGHRAELTDLAERETALGLDRLAGEVDRTAGQLRFYADVAVEGSYLGLTVDEPTPTSSAIVRVNRPLGPVGVFGASNFPFAFSVLGNDTAAALAAGCPVVVKAHPAHLGLSIRQAEITLEALTEMGAPAGTFALVTGHQAGIDLVRAPEIAAIGFTGSQAGGLALWRLANERDVVIPVFAEMGTVNPVVVTRAGAADVAGLARGFVGSFTLGHGQFCTKPGLMLAPSGSGLPDAVAAALREAAPAPVMLTRAIAQAVSDGVRAMVDAGGRVLTTVRAIDRPEASDASNAPAAVLTASPDDLRPGSRLLDECFGAVALVVEYDDDDQLRLALSTLQSSLAASLFVGDDTDVQGVDLLSLLSRKAGRVAVNEWPTGVAFTWAQHHGGPWPATSVPSATSVGAAGLARFVRPVAYQAVPDHLLPPEASKANPWNLPRRMNGRLLDAPGSPP